MGWALGGYFVGENCPKITADKILWGIVNLIDIDLLGDAQMVL